MSRLLTLRQVAAELGCSVCSVRRLIRGGKLEARRSLGVKVPREELDRYLATLPAVREGNIFEHQLPPLLITPDHS